MTRTELVLKRRNMPDLHVSSIASFTFTKDVYKAHTQLRVSFIEPELNPGDCTEVMFYVNDQLVHHGLADDIHAVRSDRLRRCTIASRGFTALLLENQLEPGFYMDLSMNGLMDNYINMPHVTHENNDDNSGYIYVKSNSVMWDGVVNLAYKLSRRHPYISGANKVMISPKADPVSIVLNSDELLNSGAEMMSRNMCSDMHMADMGGDYGSFDYSLPEAGAMGIVRHRYFDLDMRFLYDPDLAPEYRARLTQKGWRRRYCTYDGYSGEDLYDRVTFDEIAGQRIGRIVLTGDREGIRTELSVYQDGITN